MTTNDGRAILVGPAFFEESRMNEKNINAVEESNSSMTIESDPKDSNDTATETVESPEKQDDVKKMIFPADGPFQHPTFPRQQFPLIPPALPYQFKWETDPIESGPGYEPIPYFDTRSYSNQPYFPYQNIPPINPFQFYNGFA